ncbi:MAG: hypothetical protein LBC82_07610 [Oscillospiraceae bacterium]|jgi:PleD family two-component response regulator|nr:hypothetical protein [Oscillospiraceae bacterium]
MKNILIIGDNIREINKLRRHFIGGFKVSATNSAENALSVMQNKATDLAVFHAGADLSPMFGFYKGLRKNPATESLPLLVIAAPAALYALSETVTLRNTVVVDSGVSEDDMEGVINSVLG